ncbi:ribonuclease H-like domain-containing protein [Tanacetum coccineum]
MQNCNPCRTPVDTESKLGSDGDPVSDPTLYRSIATSPDLSYALQNPHDLHFTNLKRILRYVRGTLDYGLQLHVILSRSSVEAEYPGVANVVVETAWIHNLL